MSTAAVVELAETVAVKEKTAPTEVDELTRILERAMALPPNLRITLARRVLETLEVSTPPDQKTPKSLKDLVGLIKTDGPPPSDEECRKILEEERFRRYGQ